MTKTDSAIGHCPTKNKSNDESVEKEGFCASKTLGPWHLFGNRLTLSFERHVLECLVRSQQHNDDNYKRNDNEVEPNRRLFTYGYSCSCRLLRVSSRRRIGYISENRFNIIICETCESWHFIFAILIVDSKGFFIAGSSQC